MANQKITELTDLAETPAAGDWFVVVDISVGGGPETKKVSFADIAGSAQTPWLQNIDAGGFDLTGAGAIAATTFNGVALTAAGAATNYLGEDGLYSVPPGAGDLQAVTDLGATTDNPLIFNPVGPAISMLQLNTGGLLSLENSLDTGGITIGHSATTAMRLSTHGAVVGFQFEGLTDYLRLLGNGGGTGPALVFEERAAATASIAGFAQVWVDSGAAPNELIFTDDDDNDINLVTSLWDNGTQQVLTNILGVAVRAALFVGDDDNGFGAGVGSIYIAQRTAAGADFANQGQFWVSDDTNQIPMFTDRLGVDYELNAGGSQTPWVADIDGAGFTLDDFVLKDYGITSASEVVSANAFTITYDEGPTFEVDMEAATGTVTGTISGGAVSGDYGQITVKVEQDSSVPQLLNWAGGTFRWNGGSAHPVNSSNGGFTLYTFETWDGGSIWYAAGADYS